MSTKPKAKRRHLGRGLESLLGPINDQPDLASRQEQEDKPFPPDKEFQQALQMVPVAQITPNPYQPRKTWDDEHLADLAASITANGVIQPILLRKSEAGYEVIAGERRLRAAALAGLDTIPAMVRQATDAQMLELALIENIHRTDLNPLERAQAYDSYINTFSLTQTDAAKRLSEDRSVIANHLRLLDLPSEIKQMLVAGDLSMGHARAILALPTDDIRRKLANRALAGRLSVREVERLVRLSLEAGRPEKKPVEKAPNILDLEKRLREVLGTKVRIDASRRGHRGRIMIEYYTLDDFERITERLGLVKAE
ncbi:MAG: ParB/RepB/Spo0J family partition protein, partial [Dehalococcoidales bacterium]